MSNDDPNPSTDHSRSDETAPLEWAVTQTMPYAAPGTNRGEPGGAGGAPHTAPALDPPTWTGRKTAIAAALAIGISSLGAVGAAAALPAGTVLGDSGQAQRGGFGPGGPVGQGGFGSPGASAP